MKKIYMNLILVLLLLVAVPPEAFSTDPMTQYCSAPPYVTRSIAPNIMIVMDNSEDMMGPAYTDEYGPVADHGRLVSGNQYPTAEYSTADGHEYLGYFKPTGCYSYSGNKFVEELNTTPDPDRSYAANELCPDTAPFRGNLLNWATMSKYDVLQKVLVGGNSASKQGNAHTLVSISGANWPTKYEDATTHIGCVFKVNNGNLVITEEFDGTCTLLDDPAEPSALPYARQMPADSLPLSVIAESGRSLSLRLSGYLQSMTESADNVLSSAAKVWEGLDLVTPAWAAVCPAVQVSGLDAVRVGTEASLVLSLQRDSNGNKNATWSNITMPAWLGSPVLSNYESTVDATATWTGTPSITDVGVNSFSVDMVTTACSPNSSQTISDTFLVTADYLKIDMYDSLSDGGVGEAYRVSLNGQGGSGNLSWTASGLPTGLSIGTFSSTVDGVTVTNYYIEGTPTAAGDFDVILTLSDDIGTTPVQKTLSLYIVDSLKISTPALPGGQEKVAYSASLSASGGSPGYTYSITSGSLPSGISFDTGTGELSGTLADGSATDVSGGNYTLTFQVTDSSGATASKSLTISVIETLTHVEIFSPSLLPSTYRNDNYSYQIQASGGCPFSATSDPEYAVFYTDYDDGDYVYDDYLGGYMWRLDNADTAPMPSWMSLDTTTGILSGRPDNGEDITYDSFTISVMACGHHVSTKTFSITSYRSVNNNRSQSFSVKVDLEEEPLVDLNGNGSWDKLESYTDENSNGEWDGKYGVFHKFWDANEPKARWGMTKTKESGGTSEAEINTCIPVTNASSFFTNIQNATAVETAPLSDSLYGAINYYKFNSTGYTGCTNSDPIDNIPCRKNFILMITSGADLTGDSFATGGDCTSTDPLEQNACYGFMNDLRAASSGMQNAHTYIVNTMGSSSAATALEAAALAGGGAYYEATDGSDLEDQLTKAIEDILAQAASGTAVSVLTTSSRGIGSMMQAYFLPIRQDGAREVRWTGYVQNLWIDPDDNLREDTNPDFKLIPDDDDVLKLYFDNDINETQAALFDADALENCENPDIKPFDEISYTWEGGLKLADRPPSERNIFTARNIIHGTTPIDTFTAAEAEFTTSVTADWKAVLNADSSDTDAPYSTDEVISYIRGECLETGVSGDTACGPTTVDRFRDRRVTLSGGDANGNVWKLGDVISSTPKVLAGTPNNTYHVDYGDVSYYNYVSDPSYANRSAISVVGANDGMLHAFRVGYLKDTGLADGVLGLFKNFFLPENDDTQNTQIGEEVWSYIPYNALPYLKFLAKPDYCHIYYNDLSVRLTDASLGNADDSAHDDPTDPIVEESWRTILIGGMRFGGACDGGVAPVPPTLASTDEVGYSAYYAIDITDSEAPVPLWEFSDPDMGYSTGFPSILRTGDAGTNGNWYVAFGSGSSILPKSGADSTDIGRSTSGSLYILDLQTGERVQKIKIDTTDTDHHIIGDVLTIDKEKDYVTEKLYFGTSYNDGTDWNGKLYSLEIPNQDLSSWTPDTSTELKALFQGAFPITASPDAASDTAGKTWVYAGSGKYYSDVDEGATGDQIFFGIKDVDSGISYPQTNALPMLDKTAVETTGTIAETKSVCSYDPTVDGNFEMQEVVTKTNRTSAAEVVAGTGWFLTLSEGERVISRPLAVGGLVDFLTYKPSSDECSYGGNSYLYAVGYTSGEAPAKVAIRNKQTTGGTTTMNTGVTVAKGILLGPGAPPTGEAIIIPPPKEGQEQLKKKIQVATGVIVEAENTPAISTTSDVVHMLKK